MIASSPQRMLAMADGHLLVVMTETSRHERHMAVRPALPREVFTTFHIGLERRSVRRWISIGAVLVWWSIAWAVVTALFSLNFDPKPEAQIAMLSPLVLLFAVGQSLRLINMRRLATVVPLRVTRETIAPDGVHELDVLDVDGSSCTIWATRHLATALLVSSDYERGPLRRAADVDDNALPPGISPVDSSPKRKRRGARTQEELVYPSAIIGWFPQQVYDPDSLAEQYARAARAARTSPEAIAARHREAQQPLADRDLTLKEGTRAVEEVDADLPHDRACGPGILFVIAMFATPVLAAAGVLLANAFFDAGIHKLD